MRTKTEPRYEELRRISQEKENENHALTWYENEHEDVHYSPYGAEINPFFLRTIKGGDEMTNVIFAVIVSCVLVAFYFGYCFGWKDAEYESSRAAREERQRERENCRRFAEIARQTKSI